MAIWNACDPIRECLSAMLDLTHLRTFVAVVQEGHLTRAAERLHMSQPAASHHIRALEDHFGVALFIRNARGLEPTAAGLRLAQGANRVLSSTMELDGLARELQGSLSGRLVIGTVDEPNLFRRLAALVQWVRQHHPLVELCIEGRNSRAVTQGLHAGEIDVGFFVGAALPQGMDGFQVGALEFVLAAPSHWREQLRGADWSDLAALPWIVLSAGTAHADIVEGLFRPHGLKVNVALEVSNEALLRAMIRGGVGMGFVRDGSAREDVENGLLCTVADISSTTGLQCGVLRIRQSDPIVQMLLTGLHSIQET